MVFFSCFEEYDIGLSVRTLLATYVQIALSNNSFFNEKRKKCLLTNARDYLGLIKNGYSIANKPGSPVNSEDFSSKQIYKEISEILVPKLKHSEFIHKLDQHISTLDTIIEGQESQADKREEVQEFFREIAAGLNAKKQAMQRMQTRSSSYYESYTPI